MTLNQKDKFESGLGDIITTLITDKDPPSKEIIKLIMEAYLWRWRDNNPDDCYGMSDAERVLYKKFRDVYTIYKGEDNVR